jgi:hypothetical protein
MGWLLSNGLSASHCGELSQWLECRDLILLSVCDHLIDVGPGAGPEGGKIVATGTPHDLAAAPESVTGPWLADHFVFTPNR